MRLFSQEGVGQPRRPIGLGDVDCVSFVGLPGNPVAVTVTFPRVARPVVLRLAGCTEAPPRPLSIAPQQPTERWVLGLGGLVREYGRPTSAAVVRMRFAGRNAARTAGTSARDSNGRERSAGSGLPAASSRGQPFLPAPLEAA